MTNNFDQERWFTIECDALEKALREGRMDRAAFDSALEGLQRRLDALWDRLDGSYQLPGAGDGGPR